MGGGATSPDSGTSTGSDGKNPQTKIEKNAKAQLGVLSKAMVKIYELGTSPHKLLFTEITSDGDTVESIGNFNAHEKELKSDKIYLYEVHGGNDMDVDDDGVVDSSSTINEGIFRAVVKGSDVKSLGGKFKVTAVSEIQYKKVEEHIDNIAVLREKLKDAPKLIIKDDLNNDGKIDAKDILLYNPVEHEEKLEKVYKDKLEKIVKDIHKKDTEIDVSIVPKLEGNTFILAENATSGNKVGQIEILDNGQAPITKFTLKGEGSDRFTIDEKGVIKVNALSVLSLKTLKVYNLKAVATNRVGKSNEADIRINVMEIDKSAPVFTSIDTLTVAENAPLSHVVEVTDDSSVSFALEGADSEFFAFNPSSKKLTFNQSLDFENPKDENGDNVYEVIVKATDSANNSSSQTILVTLTNISDVKPVLADGQFEITTTAVGTVLGTVSVTTAGDSDITSYKLSGTGSENFAISDSGEITVKSESLSTTTATSYALKVTATNSAGESNAAFVSISYKDITNPVFKNTKTATVAENEEFSLQLQATDRTAVTYTIEGGLDKDKFSIDAEGVLTFNGTANYEEPSDTDHNNKYEVRVKAVDSAGNEAYQNVTVSVTDVADVVAVLQDTSFEVAENFKGSSLGKVKIENQGDNAISAFTLTGTGSENFHIDNHGNISLNTGVTLTKNTNYSLKAKATNGAGESNSVTVSINVTEVKLGIKGVVQLGLLKNATLKIFKINSDGNYTKLFTETTTDGDINSAGRFNTHSIELEDDTFYLYQATGGYAIDVDDDGIKDTNDTENKGAVRAIVKGSWLKSMTDDEFRITALSEMLFVYTVDTIENDFINLEMKLKDNTNLLIQEDINNDWIVDAKDIVSFNPVDDIDKLNLFSQNIRYYSLYYMANSIYNGNTTYFHPRIIGSFGRGASGVALSKDQTKAYVSVNGNGLKIIDIQNISKPIEISSVPIEDPSKVILSHDETVAYVINKSRYIKIVDIRDSKNPRLLSSIDVSEESGGGKAQDIVLSPDGSKIYVVNGVSLKIIDVTSSSNPYIMSHIDVEMSTVLAISNDGTKIFIATYFDGMKIIDVSSPSKPEQVSFVDIDSYATDIILSKDETKVYLSGVEIIDINNIVEPKLLNIFTKDSSSKKITMYADNIYGVSTKGGILSFDIFDMSDEFKPKHVDAIATTTQGTPRDIVISNDGKKAFIVGRSAEGYEDKSHGLLIVDISDKSVSEIK